METTLLFQVFFVDIQEAQLRGHDQLLHISLLYQGKKLAALFSLLKGKMSKSNNEGSQRPEYNNQFRRHQTNCGVESSPHDGVLRTFPMRRPTTWRSLHAIRVPVAFPGGTDGTAPPGCKHGRHADVIVYPNSMQRSRHCCDKSPSCFARHTRRRTRQAVVQHWRDAVHHRPMRSRKRLSATPALHQGMVL